MGWPSLFGWLELFKSQEYDLKIFSLKIPFKKLEFFQEYKKWNYQ